MAYDPGRGVVYVFSGRGAPGADLWEWDGERWREHVRQGDAPWPRGRFCPVMFHDGERLLLQGGVVFGETWSADTWAWDGTGWTELDPIRGPPAGICGGACLLASLGILDGKRCTGMTRGEAPDIPDFRYFEHTEFSNDHVVVDGNLITGQGQAYIEFAMELARQMGLVSSDAEFAEGVNWLKNVR